MGHSPCCVADADFFFFRFTLGARVHAEHRLSEGDQQDQKPKSRFHDQPRLVRCVNFDGLRVNGGGLKK